MNNCHMEIKQGDKQSRTITTEQILLDNLNFDQTLTLNN